MTTTVKAAITRVLFSMPDQRGNHWLDLAFINSSREDTVIWIRDTTVYSEYSIYPRQ